MDCSIPFLTWNVLTFDFRHRFQSTFGLTHSIFNEADLVILPVRRNIEKIANGAERDLKEAFGEKIPVSDDEARVNHSL